MQTIRRGPLLPPSTYVLFGGLGGDGRGRLRFRGVVLLNVGCGGGDSAPSLAATDATHDSAHDNGTNQHNDPGFRFVILLHCKIRLNG